MFKKRKTEIPSRRQVQNQPSARVFSYHTNRSRGVDSQSARRDQASKKSGLLTSVRQKNQSTIIKNLPLIAMLVVLLACGVFLSTLSTTPKIRIIGDENQAALNDLKDYEIEIQYILEQSIANRSKLLINTDAVTEEIKQNNPELGEVALILPLFSRRPIVHISPEKPALILSSAGGSFVISGTGRAIIETGEAPSSLKNNIPVVQDDSGLEIELGSYALPEDSVEFISQVYAQLTHAKHTPKSFVMPPVVGDLHVWLEGRQDYIKFDLRGESRPQVGSFLAVNRELTKNGTLPKQYTDVRIPGRVFYK